MEDNLLCVPALPDGVHFVVATSSEPRRRLYHVDGTLIHSFKGTPVRFGLAVTLDGQHIISGADDKASRCGVSPRAL